MQHIFLYISLPLFSTNTTGNFQKLFYGGNVVRILVNSFFHCRSLSPCIGGRQHFSFCDRRYKIIMLFFQQKISPLFSISHSRSLPPFFLVEFRWPAAYSLFFSVFLSLYIPNLWT